MWLSLRFKVSPRVLNLHAIDADIIVEGLVFRKLADVTKNTAEEFFWRQSGGTVYRRFKLLQAEPVPCPICYLEKSVREEHHQVAL